MSERAVLTVDDVCKEMNIGRSTFYDWQKQNKAPPTFKIGSRTFVLREKYLAWLEERAGQ